MKADRIVRPAMLLLLGALLPAVATSPASAQAPGVQLTCVDAMSAAKGGDRPQKIQVSEYSVALLGDTIRRAAPNQIVARATLVFNGIKFPRGVYPLVDTEGADLFVQCQDRIRPELIQYMPTVTLETGSPGEANDLIAKLKGLAEKASPIVKRGKDAPWPAFILFTDEFQPIGTLARPFFESLYLNFRASKQDAAFLAGVTYPVTLRSQFANLVHSPAGGGAPDGASARQGGNQQQIQQQAVVQQQGQAQQPGPPAQQAQRQGAQTRSPAGANRPNGQFSQQPAQGTGAAVPLSVQQAIATVTFRFRANHDQWQALLDPDRLRNDLSLFDTSTYCGEPVGMGGGAYKMQCTLRPDRKVPIRIRGFRPIMIDAEGAFLDDYLQVAGFSYPYPKSWKRPQTEFVEVQGGNLRDVLARRIPLSQGIAGCQTETAVASLENIVASALQFPAEPCRAYDVIFQQLPLAQNATVLNGCVAAAPDQAVLIQNNRITCWAPSMRAEPTVLKVQLFSGFRPVDLTIFSTAENEVTYTFDMLAAALQPPWPYAAGIVDSLSDSPAYAARTVQYVVDGGGPCGRPVPVASVGGPLPTLKDAGCNQLPRGMTVVLEQDANAPRNLSSPPLDAFRPRFEDPIDLAAPVQGRTIPADQLKLVLPVNFSAQDTNMYNAQFGTGAGNSQSLAGVFLFQGNCTTKREAIKFVPFNGQPTPATYKWPIKAAVFDGSDDPLTLCATASVGGVQSNSPYLTFGLQGARAAGPRRAIVISMSTNLARAGGTKAVQESLRNFVDQISGQVARGARLSPINVFQVNGAGEFRQLFTGEAAAQDRESVKAQITQSQESVAPVTPEFRQLRLIPELKKDSVPNFDRVIFVMDGSEVVPDNTDFLAGLSNQFKNRDLIHLMMIGNCAPWLAQNPNITCTPLPADPSQRSELLTKAFGKFINATELQAADLPGDIRPSVQGGPAATPAPAPGPAAGPPAQQPAAPPHGGGKKK